MFERCGPGVVCEVHLLVESQRHLFPAEYGYCGRRARWWCVSYGLCEKHKAALEELIRTQRRKET